MSNKIFGYIRVSKKEQETGRQETLLLAHGVPVENLYIEKMTGTIAQRPVLDELKKSLRDGDTIIVESISRLGRRTTNFINLLTQWREHGYNFISIKESFDLNTPVGAMMLTVMSVVAQLERDLIQECVTEGLQNARARGRVGGRPRLPAHVSERALKLYDAGSFSVSQICHDSKISKTSLYRIINARKREKIEDQGLSSFN